MKSGSETFSLNPYTLTEEVWHACVHGFGILFGVAGLSLLLVFSSIYGNVWSIVSCAIFGTTIILLYTASTLYHAIPNQHTKKHLKKFDHIAIYYLIAGTYTPFLLVNMNGPLGWTLFGIVWGLAILGTCLKVLMPPNGTKLWSIGLYVLMGWLILFASHKLASSIPKVGFIFVVLGGLFYTLGIFFYIQKKRRYMHVVWHFFVLLGTMMHFFAVLFSCVFLT